MRILYILPNVTGLSTFFSTGNLIDEGMPSMFKPIKHLQTCGHKLTILVYPYYTPIIKNINIQENNLCIKSLTLKEENVIIKTIRKVTFGFININPLFEIIYLTLQIVKINKQLDYKLIYGQDNIGIIVGYILSKIFKKPLISRLYGVSFMRRSKGKINILNKLKYWGKYLPLKIKSDCLLITNDGSISYQELKQIKPYSKNYKLLFNGYDNTSINRKNKLTKLTKDKIFTLINISTLSNWKNVDSVIDIYNLLLKRGCNAHLLIVGDGTEEFALKELVLKYNIGNSVTFTGRIPQKQVYEYLNKSDVFLNLYDRQNLTNTLWEAMSMGNCVITRSEFENNKEIIKHGQNGYLFPINKKEEIVDCIEILYNNRKLLDKIGSKAKKMVEKLLPTWDERIQLEYQLIKSIYKRVY